MKKLLLIYSLFTVAGLKAQTGLTAGLGSNLAFGEGRTTIGQTVSLGINQQIDYGKFINVSVTGLNVSNKNVPYPSELLYTKTSYNQTAVAEATLMVALLDFMYGEIGMGMIVNKNERAMSVIAGGGFLLVDQFRNKLLLDLKAYGTNADYVKAYARGDYDFAYTAQIKLVHIPNPNGIPNRKRLNRTIANQCYQF